MVIYKDLNHVGTERRDTTYRIPALKGGILHVVSRCYVLNQLGNATSDPTAFKIRQVPSSVLAALGLYNQSFKILNAVESSVALSNYYIVSGMVQVSLLRTLSNGGSATLVLIPSTPDSLVGNRRYSWY